MNTLNLYDSDPTALVDSATTSDLVDAIMNLEAWDEKSLETANLLITVWSSNSIARPNDRESISELQRIIHYALNRSAAAATLPEEYRYRWEEASDLLEARRLNLVHADPEAQLNRRHVDKILALVSRQKNEEFLQSALVTYLGVTNGRVTQLVGPLEANGLLTKRKTGRDIVLRLTTTGKRLAEKFNMDKAKTSPIPNTDSSSCPSTAGFASLFLRPDIYNKRYDGRLEDLNKFEYSPSERPLAQHA